MTFTFSQSKIRRGRVGPHQKQLWLALVACAFVTTSFFVMMASKHIQQEQESRIMNTPFQPSQNKESLKSQLSPSVWSQAGRNSNPQVAQLVDSLLTQQEKTKAKELCGSFLFSSITKAVKVGDMGEQTFVTTGDIHAMWTRDSAVQMSLYVSRFRKLPFLRQIVEGAIRRQAFHILQDPYANAYEQKWVDASKLQLRDAVLGRGGWVSTRNYELDSGAYFFTQLYDYYVADGLYKPELLLAEPMIFDAVNLMVDTWIVEQHHDAQSPYRYFELANGGRGPASGYTGMTWTGFRPSDDACKYSYLIPANIFAAGSLERILLLNQHIWQSQELHQKANKLLREIEEGIRTHGVVKTKDTGELMYAYEVDGLGNALYDFDDANVPSLLSIPLLGWSGYDKQVYETTRERLLSPKNTWYFNSTIFRGIGSYHTGRGAVWPLAFAVQALTEQGSTKQVAESFVFQLRQSLASACNDAMHESVNANKGCAARYTRPWFEWSNALFVVLLESALGIRCDEFGLEQARNDTAMKSSFIERRKLWRNESTYVRYYNNPYRNNYTQTAFFQGLEAKVSHNEN